MNLDRVQSNNQQFCTQQLDISNTIDNGLAELIT